MQPRRQLPLTLTPGFEDNNNDDDDDDDGGDGRRKKSNRTAADSGMRKITIRRWRACSKKKVNKNCHTLLEFEWLPYLCPHSPPAFVSTPILSVQCDLSARQINL